METIYTVDFFINKFENIESLGTGDTKNKCALYYCGVNDLDSYNYPEEAKALIKLFGDPSGSLSSYVWAINDGTGGINNINSGFDDLPTAKQRILAYLYDIKAKQQPEPKEKIVYKTVVIDGAVKELQNSECLSSN